MFSDFESAVIYFTFEQNLLSNLLVWFPVDSEELNFKDTELKMLVVGLKEVTTTKEVIQTLEQLLCDETSQLEDERNEVMHSRDTFQDLVRLMDQHRVERTVQLSILRQGVDHPKVVLGVNIYCSS